MKTHTNKIIKKFFAIFSLLILGFSVFSPSFSAWTDDPLVAGQTVMKAKHLNEIRDTLERKCNEGEILLGFDENQQPICSTELKNITGPIRAVLVDSSGTSSFIWQYLVNNNLVEGTVDTTSDAETLAAANYDIYVFDRYVYSITKSELAYSLWNDHGKNVITVGNDTRDYLYPIVSSISSPSPNVGVEVNQNIEHYITDNISGDTTGNMSDSGREIITQISDEFETLYHEVGDESLIYGVIGHNTISGGVWFHDQTGKPHLINNLLEKVVEYMSLSSVASVQSKVQENARLLNGLQDQIDSGAASEWTRTNGGINYSDGNVGIGNDTPSVKLDVVSDIFEVAKFKRNTGNNGGGAILAIENDKDTQWKLGVGSNSHFGIYKDGENFGNQFIIENSGNIGIRNPNPGSSLQIGTNQQFSVHKATGFKTAGTEEYYLLGVLNYNNGALHVEGLLGGHNNNEGAGANIDISFNARDEFRVLGNINGTLGDSSKGSDILVFKDDDEARLYVYLELASFASTNLNLRSSSGANVRYDSQAEAMTYDQVLANHTSELFRLSEGGQADRTIRIKNNGNIGIGTVDPDTKLHLLSGDSGVTKTDANMIIEDSNNAVFKLFTPNNSGGFIGFGDPEDDQSGLIGYEHNGDYFKFVTNATEKLRITSSGNVGVGTTTPVGKFDVDGSICISGDCKNSWAEVAASGTSIWNTNTAGIHYSTANVGIGTQNPTEKLEVQNSKNGEVSFPLKISNTYNTDNTGAGIKFKTDPSYNGGEIYLNRDSQSGPRHSLRFSAIGQPGDIGRDAMVIKDNGNIGIGTTAPKAPVHINNTSTIKLLAGRADNAVPENSLLVSNTAGTSNFAGFAMTVGSANKGSAIWSQTNSEGLRLKGNVDDVTSLMGEDGDVFIAPSGNVGIGTTNPTSTLEVAGEIELNNENLFYTVENVLSSTVSNQDETNAPWYALNVPGTSRLFNIYVSGPYIQKRIVSVIDNNLWKALSQNVRILSESNYPHCTASIKWKRVWKEGGQGVIAFKVFANECAQNTDYSISRIKFTSLTPGEFSVQPLSDWVGADNVSEQEIVPPVRFSGNRAAFGGYEIDNNHHLTTPSLYSAKGEFGELCIGSGNGSDCKTSWEQIVNSGGGISVETDPKIAERNLDKITVSDIGNLSLGSLGDTEGKRLVLFGGGDKKYKMRVNTGGTLGFFPAEAGETGDIGEVLTLSQSGTIGVLSDKYIFSEGNRIYLDKDNLSIGARDNNMVFSATSDLFLGANNNGNGTGDIYLGGGNITPGANGWENYMTLKNSGNVGIGTISPEATLHVNGVVKAAYLDASGGVKATHYTTANGNLNLNAGGWGADLYMDSDGNSPDSFRIYDGGIRRFNFWGDTADFKTIADNGGGVFINSPDGGFEIMSGNDNAGYIDFKGLNNLSKDFQGRIGYTDGVGFQFAVNENHGNPIFGIRENGGVYSTGKITSASTVSGDSATTLTTKDYVDARVSGAVGGVSQTKWTDTTGGIKYNDRVAIGNVIPQEKLHVSGDMLLAGQDLFFSIDPNNPDTNTDSISYDDASVIGSNGVFTFNADNIKRPSYTNPTAAISARGGYFLGNVGIGTSNPQERLVINGQQSDTSAAKKGMVNIIPIGGYAENIRNRLISSQDRAFIDYRTETGGKGTWILGSQFNEVKDTLTVHGNGKVGIGTSSPLSKLHIALEDNESFLTGILFDGGTEDIAIPDGQILQLGHLNKTNGSFTERMRIETNGNIGIGTDDPKTKLDVNGGIALSIKTVSTNYQLTNNDYMVLCDASSGSKTFTLPNASTAKGVEINIKKKDSSGNSCKVLPKTSETIDGRNNQDIDSQYESYSFISDGAAWWIK